MEDKIDRLSGLPEAVLEHIIALIPLKQVPQLLTLSKTWQKAPSLFSNLEFELLKVPSNEEKSRRKREGCIAFVEKTLLSRNREKLCINKFDLDMVLDDESEFALVNRWIGYAIDCKVKNLIIRFNKSYPVPESVVAAKSITELKLYGCKFKSFYSDINLPSLKKLVLFQVYVEDQFVQALIGGCPLVEEMKFDHCYGFKSLHVSGLPKLMVIELRCHSVKSVEMEASNLQVFKLWKPCQINLFSCENLKELCFYESPMTDECLHEVLSKSPLIERLNLRYCDMLERITILSNLMKELLLFNCKRLVEVDIVTPNLHTLQHSGRVVSFSSNNLTLSELDLNFENGTFLTVNRIEFLAKLGQPKLLTVRADDIENMIASKGLREIQPSPFYNVKQLKLDLVFQTPRQITETVDALLWICPLLEILFIQWEKYKGIPNNISFKFSYGNPIYKSKNSRCCELLPVLCWRHCLKTIEIERFGGSKEEEETLKKYFWKNTEILESFKYL